MMLVMKETNSDNKARPVALQELHSWLKENIELTWYLGKLEDGRHGHFRAMKYLDMCLDTRTMSVWKIDIRGGITVSTHDDFDGNILELLKERIYIKYPFYKEGYKEEHSND